jgi:hypothetical protein
MLFRSSRRFLHLVAQDRLSPTPRGGAVGEQAHPVGNTITRLAPNSTATLIGVLLATTPSIR